MDSLQIKKILSENRGTGQVFRGCFASDQLPPPSALQYPAALVVNRDSHYKECSHWCAIYARGMEAPALYYDSLAQPIPPAVTSSFLCPVVLCFMGGSALLIRSWLPRRGFLINELLGEMVQEGAGTSSSTSKTAKDYVRKLDSTIEHVPRFQYSKAKSRFSIEDVPAAANPEGLLAGIFQYSIDAAVADSRERGIHPTHLGCLISSPLLTGGDIPIPIRQITDNTVNTILNQFVKVAQSKKQQNVTLWGEPFTVVVTTVNRPGLPTKRTLKGGVRRALAPVRHRINDRSLIKINNPDERNYCLFYALQATMVAKSRGWASWKFLDYVHSRHGQQGCLQRDALQLLQQIGARPGLNAYDAEIVVPRVVDHWNNTQQRHRFAVFIFGSSGQYKPLYKYINNYYDTPIALYLNNGHFDGVKKEYGLFECGVIWDIRAHNLNGPRVHKCDERYCQTCNNFHNVERGCYIQQIEPKENDPYRIVAFDLETMQHQAMDPHQPEKREHQPNFIAARVACPDCIENGKWKRATAGCQICGPHRTVVFCQRRFMDTQVDKQVVADNPLEPFVNWLVFELPKKCDTYAYSHFGGRFDMVLVFRELFRIGFNPEMLRRGNKMYEMKVRKQKRRNPNIVFRDSFNLMPCSLAALIPSYGLDVEDKPFFPHLANRPENYGREIHPTPDDYLANGMMPGKRRQFDEWYAAHHQEPFMLDEALAR
ncbi:hypothetical protein niasHS_009700 [Heterodera schachtii]|uniref:DNA-directed DNA polymerase n=1 Tax=Heterodera schachtii TaxID=97005 RepID=A0ABD2J138_HETSC